MYDLQVKHTMLDVTGRPEHIHLRLTDSLVPAPAARANALRACHLVIALCMIAPAGAKSGYSPGRVALAPLHLFAPERLHGAFDLLREGHGERAAPLFQKALAADPSEMAAYIGLMQARPELWPGEMRRVEAALRETPTDPIRRLKLATLLWLRYHEVPVQIRRGKESDLARARTLAMALWNERRIPLAALLLADIDLDRLPQRRATLEALLRDLAGDHAWRLYRDAEKEGWRAEPPPAAMVDSANRRPLSSVVRALSSIAGRREGDIVTENGKTVHNPDGTEKIHWDPIPPDLQRQYAYLRTWAAALVP